MRVFLCLLALVSPAFAAGPYTVISSVTTSPAPSILRTETVIQDGASSTDRFTMTRVHRNVPDHALKGAVLLQPGQSANFELYEMDENGVYKNSVAGYLAQHNYDVWGYSPRTKGIASGACTLTNCPYMANWGINVVISDTEYINQQIFATQGYYPVLFGWSLGAMTTIATLNDQPSHYQGAVIWEGLLYSTDSSVIAGNVANCTQYTGFQTAGQYAGGTTIATLKSIASFPEPLRKNILVDATTTPLPCPPAFVPGYTFLAGNGGIPDVTLDWQFASEARLVDALLTFNDYESNKISVDVYCSLAGDRTYTNNLSAYTAPLLVIRTGHGMGPYMDDNLGLLGTATVNRSTMLQSAFGHGDHYAAANHLTYLEIPVTSWLDNVIFP